MLFAYTACFGYCGHHHISPLKLTEKINLLDFQQPISRMTSHSFIGVKVF